VESSWRAEFESFASPPAASSLDQCPAGPAPWWVRRQGGAWLYGTKANPRASRVFRESALWGTGQTNLGPDFTAFAFASNDADAAPDIPGAGVYQPDRVVSGATVIAYACHRLRLRQLQIAATTAAAYVPAGVLESMGPGFLRARIETTRAQILETGARGVDLQIAAAADPVYAQACAAARVQWKKTALMTGTPAPKPDTAPGASAALAGVQDFSPGPSNRTGVGPVLALGGLGLIFAMMGRGNG